MRRGCRDRFTAGCGLGSAVLDVQAPRVQLEQADSGRKVSESMGCIHLVWSTEYFDGYCNHDSANANALAAKSFVED
jgi:hypothetical protein